VPRYAFCCRACGLEFEVSRSMSDAGREAACPVDNKGADRIFTAPMTSVRLAGRQGESEVTVLPEGGATRSWSSPFFPKVLPAGEAARPAPAPRHVLPAGSSKPTRFKHFGHWHPAGTPAHTHQARRPAPKPSAAPEA
jgi:putative FmdB family regulatory protein